MDLISPVIGAVTGLEMAQWKDIFIFSGKVFLFCLPFLGLGLLVERDVLRVPALNRLFKTLVVLMFTLPIILFGALNYFAPKLPEPFWEKYPFLEDFWIMEGTWPPILLMAMAALYFLLYAAEVMRGDMSR